MNSAKEKDGTQVQNNSFGSFKAFTFIKQDDHNMAWSFVGKYEQVSTYVSWKIPLYQNYKR